MKKIGVIADDFTGATDIAGFLVANGITTVQVNGVPDHDLKVQVDSWVVSLKSRSCPKEQAVRDSLSALKWLQGQGCEQIYFKYCSTFDSTEKGNIGPVIDALMQELETDQTVVCPASLSTAEQSTKATCLYMTSCSMSRGCETTLLPQ